MANMSQTKNLIRKEATSAMQRARRDVLTETKQEANKDTTAMARSIMATMPHGSGSSIKMEIYVPVPYAKYVIFGTRAHGPKRAKAMTFIGRGGFRVFTKWVRGYRGNDFFFEPMPKRFRSALRRAMR